MNVLPLEVLYHGAVAGAVLGLDVEVLEEEVLQFVLLGGAGIEEDVAVEGDVAQGDVVGVGHGDVLAALQVEELRPGLDVDEALGIALHVVHQDVLVVLRSVGTHLEPQQATGVADGAAAQDDVVVVDGLAAAGQAAVAEAVGAVLDDDVAVAAVVDVLVGIGAFAALQGYGIVVDGHVAALHQYIAADVDVDGIAAGSLDGLGRGEDVEVEQLHAVATVEVGGPEGGVDEVDAADLYVVAVGDEEQARTHLFQVGAFGVILPTQPEGAPVAVSVAVEGAFAGDGEAIYLVGIDQCGKILQVLSLHAGVDEGKVADVVAALQHGTFL